MTHECDTCGTELPTGVDNIFGTITLRDGTDSYFLLTSSGYVQWGANTTRLGETVAVVEAMLEAARLHFPTENQENPR